MRALRLQPRKPIVGMIGLGIMGSAMAKALIAADFRVIGTDIRATRRRWLQRAGGSGLASCGTVASNAEVLITSLPTVAALDQVVAEIALACERSRKSQRELLVIETSTLPIADKKRAMSSLKRVGVSMIDCPISGTARRMKEGGWTIFVSGRSNLCKRGKSIFDAFSRNAPYVGAFGNGSKMKFIANHLVAIYNVSIGESMTFARRMGLDPHQVWALLAASPVVGNGVFRLRGKLMVERRYRPATMKVDVWQKDMQVIGDMARSVGCPIPLFAACIPVYNAAMAQGFGQHDTASVCEVLGGMAGGKFSRRKTAGTRLSPQSTASQ